MRCGGSVLAQFFAILIDRFWPKVISNPFYSGSRQFLVQKLVLGVLFFADRYEPMLKNVLFYSRNVQKVGFQKESSLSSKS